ncbi:MAG: hypothetical protein NC898_00680 [Candidatus Omnitrophica bacterium]|nr:hypothetical protein [Candidatus Omnitrophota bacterium]MCM8792972.1 hypothetical protein [Candidatus Omnitrophota bacterium]
MEKERRKKIFLAIPFQRNILTVVCLSIAIPTAIAISCLYFLFFKIIVQQPKISEAVIFNLISLVRRLNLVLLISSFIFLWLMLKITLRISHRLVGPLMRLERELSERLVFDKKGPLLVRKKDDLKSLFDKINKLLAKD